MKFALVTLVFAGSAFAGFHNATKSIYTETVNTVVTKFTTYCPEATELVVNNKTITVTGETTLTVTDCPCTIPTTRVVTCTETVCKPTSAPTTPPKTCTKKECKPKPKPTKYTSYYETVVTEYTTYCPSPTTLTHGSVTIPVTVPGVVTVTTCPKEGCTVTTGSVLSTSVPVLSTKITSTYETAVTEYTTFCPTPTTLTHGSVTIPIETAGTVTISSCPEEGCVIQTSSVLTEVPITTPVIVPETSTTETYSPLPTQSIAPTTIPIQIATGAADRVVVPFAGLVALLAFLL